MKIAIHRLLLCYECREIDAADMARRVSTKCVECWQLSAAQAHLLHGKLGDACWNEKRYPRRRSYY
jgi:hypothetical protein